MRIYGNDARTGKRSSAVQKAYVAQPKQETERLYQNDRYTKLLAEGAKLAQELKNDPNHPMHGKPKTDYIRKEDWCPCPKCAARRELLRERSRAQKKRAAKKGKQASHKKAAAAVYNEFGEVVYQSAAAPTSYKNKTTSRHRRMPTSNRLSQAIAASSLTRAQVANESGISVQTLTRMCRHDEYGTLASWLLVCKTLGVRLSDILED